MLVAPRSPLWGSMIRKLLLLLLLTTPVFADDALLFVERIEVRNHKRVSPDVVIAESRLHEERAYSEADLRDAATRLSRLPFLLSVDFSLEKGSERGRHVLVLTINETKPFFFLLDGITYFEDDVRTDVEYEDRPSGSSENLALGFRWFVGRRGAVHVGFAGSGTDRAFTREYASFVAGYTQYDLFGTRAFATLNLKRPVEGYGEGLLSPQLVLGIPLSPNQTVTLEYDETRFTGEKRTFDGIEYENSLGQRMVSARWSYNTTNDPFFPTRGTLLNVAPHFGWADGVSTYWVSGDGAEAEAFHSRIYGARAEATRFRELSERSSVWGDLRGEWAHNDRRSDHFAPFDLTASSAGAGVGYAFSLWSPERRAHGDSRFEVIARYTNRTDPEYDSFYEPEAHVYQVSGAWIRRTSWGTLRMGVGYAW